MSWKMLTLALENKAWSQRLKNLPIKASRTMTAIAAMIIPIIKRVSIVFLR
jgi:hypothetical protein